MFSVPAEIGVDGKFNIGLTENPAHFGDFGRRGLEIHDRLFHFLPPAGTHPVRPTRIAPRSTGLEGSDCGQFVGTTQPAGREAGATARRVASDRESPACRFA